MNEAPRADRAPALFCVAGVAVAAIAVPLAAAGGAPYLSFDALSPWIVVYAIGLYTADARWERALLWWGAIAIAALAVGLLLGLPSGFASDSLAGSVGLVTCVEAGLVLGTLAIWLLSG